MKINKIIFWVMAATIISSFALLFVGCDKNDIIVENETQNAIKEYYVSDFLCDGASTISATIPYLYEGLVNIDSEGNCYLEEEDLKKVRKAFGEVKLELYNKDELEIIPYLVGIDFRPDYRLLLNYEYKNYIQIVINNNFQDDLNVNLFVDVYENSEFKHYKALLSDETLNCVLELALFMFENAREA